MEVTCRMTGAVPQLVAHRGLMAHYPENTLEGLEAAMRAGAPYVEFDIQSSLDRQLVLYHDRRLRRTSGVAGEIFDYPLSELSRLSAGEATRFGDRFSHLRIPTLSQLVELAQAYPHCRLLAEIKSECLARFGLEPLMEQLFHELYPMRNRCLIISFCLPALCHIRVRKQPFQYGWVLNGYGEKQRQLAERLMPALLIADSGLLTPESKPWPGPWQWMVYEINDAALALTYGAAGVALVETADVTALLNHPHLRLDTERQ